jgi:hypothetical protein
MKQYPVSRTYERIQSTMQTVLIIITPFLGLNARRDRQMTKTSERSSDGRKKTKATGDTLLTYMDRWTNLVEIREVQVIEKQSYTKAADIFNGVIRKRA